MRTTVDLDEDLLQTVKTIARIEGRSMGRVLSDLARKGLRPAPSRLDENHGFPVFKVTSDAAPITPEMVEKALEDAP